MAFVRVQDVADCRDRLFEQVVTKTLYLATGQRRTTCSSDVDNAMFTTESVVLNSLPSTHPFPRFPIPDAGR